MEIVRWFDDFAKKNFEEHVLPLAGMPINYLELGVFQGRSLLWMAQHVLTHADSRAIGVDPWDPAYMRKADEMESSFAFAKKSLRPWKNKVRLFRQTSSGFLRDSAFSRHTFDVIYIDGDHSPASVLEDSVLCWPLLKLGGLIIWDDYAARSQSVKTVVKLISRIYGDCWHTLFSNYQFGVRKTGDAPPVDFWRRQTLLTDEQVCDGGGDG